MDNELIRQSLQNELKLQDKLLQCNQYTQRFGLVLNEEDSAMLLAERKESLKTHGRVEFSESILPALIMAFCDSAYIYQDNYLEMMERLLDIFYLYKNESLDILTDDELIDYMRKHFEGECEGSVEHLEDTCLEQFARDIRERPGIFMSRGTMDEYD